MERVTDFISLGSKITADGGCKHEIKRRLFLRRKAMTNLDSSLLRGWFPYAGAVLGNPNAHVKAPKHIHTSLLCNRAPGKPSLAGAFWAQQLQHQSFQ